jgi:hypothetical protein
VRDLLRRPSREEVFLGIFMKKKMGKVNFDDGVEIHQTINFKSKKYERRTR